MQMTSHDITMALSCYAAAGMCNLLISLKIPHRKGYPRETALANALGLAFTILTKGMYIALKRIHHRENSQSSLPSRLLLKKVRI